ncbi:MAG: ATP-binding cassette domain-containing protein [Caldithrix sp.]|nr:ATP-binding cassette domain-containing protein [Caldithrix sp.]
MNSGTNNNIPIEIHDMTVAYHKKPVLWDIDVTAPEGKLIGIIGPNGAGKSTLVKAVLDLIPKASGWVKIYGQPYTDMRSLVGYVPQKESVDWDFPVNVRDVVLMGLYGQLGWFKRPKKQHIKSAEDSLKQVDMEDYADRQISQLSGGQQQRVFLARALAQDAQIYLMDEPFAGVDAATENAIIKLLSNLREKGKTVLVVHHDLSTIPKYFDWLMMLNMRIIAAGPVKEVFTTENLRRTYGGKLTVLTEAADKISQAGSVHK